MMVESTKPIRKAEKNHKVWRREEFALILISFCSPLSVSNAEDFTLLFGLEMRCCAGGIASETSGLSTDAVDPNMIIGTVRQV